jgi:hypothetical protein
MNRDGVLYWSLGDKEINIINSTNGKVIENKIVNNVIHSLVVNPTSSSLFSIIFDDNLKKYFFQFLLKGIFLSLFNRYYYSYFKKKRK